MCGIVGILHAGATPANADVIQAMAHSIRHRGPDGEGIYCEGSLGLGFRRLAVIDPTESSDQPMRSACGKFALVYNGEVYNFRELRTELMAKGHTFRSSGDTEVVLNAIIEWGQSAIDRFNGMFALAFWDGRHRTLMLARDRYGIKPLYYLSRPDQFVFASEVKAILKVPSIEARLHQEALVEYLTFQNFFGQDTLFQGVKMMPAGSIMLLRQDRVGSPETHRYWDYDFRTDETPLSLEEYEEELRRLLVAAVKRQMVSDVPLGAFLSGGMDSGSIVAIASGQQSGLQTFTIGFDQESITGLELAFDERTASAKMAAAFGTHHLELALRSGDMERVMRDLVWHVEEPRVGQSYPNYFAAELAKKSVTVSLAGTGGDEIFAGYPWRYYRAAVNEDFEDYIDKYYLYWQRLIPNKEIKSIFAPIADRASKVWTRDLFRDVFSTDVTVPKSGADYINHSLYFEAKTFLHGLLTVEDKLSMAHGLEVRFPMLDNDLVDFAMKVPVDMKLGNLGEIERLNENEPGPKTRRFFERTRDGKLILRSVSRGLVPDEVSSAVKQGFSGPDASWFRGQSIDFVRDLLLCPNAKILNYLDKDTVHRLVNEHLDGLANRRLLLWSLLWLENWIDIFADGNNHGHA